MPPVIAPAASRLRAGPPRRLSGQSSCTHIDTPHVVIKWPKPYQLAWQRGVAGQPMLQLAWQRGVAGQPMCSWHGSAAWQVSPCVSEILSGAGARATVRSSHGQSSSLMRVLCSGASVRSAGCRDAVSRCNLLTLTTRDYRTSTRTAASARPASWMMMRFMVSRADQR